MSVMRRSVTESLLLVTMLYFVERLTLLKMLNTILFLFNIIEAFIRVLSHERIH